MIIITNMSNLIPCEHQKKHAACMNELKRKISGVILDDSKSEKTKEIIDEIKDYLNDNNNEIKETIESENELDDNVMETEELDSQEINSREIIRELDEYPKSNHLPGFISGIVFSIVIAIVFFYFFKQ